MCSKHYIQEVLIMGRIVVLSLCCVYLAVFAGCYEKNIDTTTNIDTAINIDTAMNIHTTINTIVQAEYTANQVRIDGRLDDAVWQRAAVYRMNLSADKEKAGSRPEEGGQVQFAWDKEYFYLAATFEDSDIVAKGDKDQLHHYQLGDVCELFLKPGDKIWYWELYVTPGSKKTTFWFPSGPGSLEDYKSGLAVAAENSGTLNDRTDKDTRWTAEMAMPVKDLCARGEAFGPGSDWRVFVGRYNYSNYLQSGEIELSMTPQLSATNYHLINEYGRIDFVGGSE